SRGIPSAVAGLGGAVLGMAILAAALSRAAAGAQLLLGAGTCAVLAGAALATAQRGLRDERREGGWPWLPGLAVACALFLVFGLWVARQGAWAAFTPLPEGAPAPAPAAGPGW